MDSDSSGSGRHFSAEIAHDVAVKGSERPKPSRDQHHVIVEFRDKAARASGGGRTMEGWAEVLVSGGEYEEIRSQARKFLAPLIAIQRTTARIWSVLLHRKVDFRDCAIVVELGDPPGE